jgi:hypothetical protein
MSFTSIPNQPIIFRTESQLAINCNCNDDEFIQLVDYDDQIFFQLKSESCDSPLIPYIERDEIGWGIPDINGNMCSTLITQVGHSYITFGTFFPFQAYEFTLTINSLTQGAINISCVGSANYTIYTAGTYTFYFEYPTITSNSITFKIESFNGFVGCINPSIIAHGIPTSSQLKVGLVDSKTLEQVLVINPTYINSDNHITIAIDVPDLEVGEGCYRLAIADFCTNSCSQFFVENNTFAIGRLGIQGWDIFSLDAIWDFGNQFCITMPTGDGEVSLTNDSEFCEGNLYYIQINIVNVSNIAIYAQIGDNQVQYPIGATGIQTIAITAGSPSIEFGMKLNFFFQGTGAGVGTCCITNVYVGIDDSSITWNYYSDIISIGDYDDECKYLKVEGCNAQDQFGFSFSGSSFLPSIRLEGMRTKAQYESNANLFRYSSGKWSTNYADITKQWTYHFGRLPEYVLDFLSTIFYYDNCYVNGFLVSPADDKFPQIKYDDADPKLGMFEIDLLAKNKKIVKSVCLSSDASCLPSILDNSDEPFLLSQDAERLITQEGVNLYYEF